MVNSWELSEDKQVNNFSAGQGVTVPLCCARLVEGSTAAQAELKCWWMPHPLAGLKRALLGWQHTGGAFTNTKTERKTRKKAIFNFEKEDYLWYLESHTLFKKQTSPKPAALWATNWSASLQQAYLNDLNDLCSCCAPGTAPIPNHPPPPDLELDAM